MNTEKLGKYGETLLLWALCTVCTSAAVCIYMNTVINLWSVLGAVISALVILFADFARTKKLGGLLYVAVLFCVGLVPALAINDISEMFSFVRWFFSGSEAVETETGFILTLTVMMSFLFTSAAYYFTKVIYRSSVMTLITLVPFAIAVKTAISLPYGYAAIAAALNIIFFILNARKNVEEGAVPKGKATLIVYADFTIAIILLALILPKPSVAPYYEKFEEVTSRFQFGGTGENQYTGEYKNSSGVTDDLRRGESVLLYAVNTPAPVYLKTQVFDIYDYEQGAWLEADEMIGSKRWQETASLLSYKKLGKAVSAALEAEPSIIDYYPQAERLAELTETESYATIYSQSYPAVYVLAPLRATGLTLFNVNADYSARTDDGEIFTNNRFLPENASYTVRYYTEDIFEQLVSMGLCDVSFEDYGEFISFAYGNSELHSEEEKILREFYNQHSYAEDYAEMTETEVSAEIQALADEITAGLEYDYQKAEAIEQYFHHNGFIYSLSYEAPKDSDTPEYFLFESKTGICSDFATAYTLLARAAGLTVRYVEGFVMQSSGDTPNMYSIYTDNAHAYPEVYIPGAGWIVYEPTPSNILAAGSGTDGDVTETDPLAILFTAIIAVIVAGIFILIILFAPKILEGIFRIKVKLSDNNKAVILLYNRHSSNMEHRFAESCKSFTPEQLKAYTEKKTAVSLEPLTKPFIRACYGGTDIETNEKTKAFECYKAQYKAIRKIKKRKD